jgi:hypothetical protein
MLTMDLITSSLVRVFFALLFSSAAVFTGLGSHRRLWQHQPGIHNHSPVKRNEISYVMKGRLYSLITSDATLHNRIGHWIA